MNGRNPITIKSHQLWLCSPGGVFDPVAGTLYVADTHFGKDATFRQHAVPVPEGTTDETLQKIKRMLHTNLATKLVILGDMFHDQTTLTPSTVHSLESFFDEIAPVSVFLVPGNHDSQLRRLPSHWPIQLVKPGTTWTNIVLSHYPVVPEDPSAIVLAGHIHPAVRIGSGTDRLKLRCFWYREGTLVLPALGSFTGSQIIEPKTTDQVWLVADDEIIQWG